MQSLRKSVLVVLMAVFVASLMLAPAHAQSGIAANVPFDFVLGKTTMKAGNYRIGLQGAFVMLSGSDGSTTYSLLRAGGDASDRNGQPYLVFTRYGTESFLNKVVFSVNNAYTLPRSSREKEVIARSASGEQVAVLIQPVR